MSLPRAYSHRYNHSVDVESLRLRLRIAHLLIPAHKDNLRDPRRSKGRNRERRGRRQRDDIARRIALGPQVRRPDERRVHDGGDNANGDSLLLRRLTARGSAPSEDERVDAVGADGEDDHSHVATRNTERRACDEEADGGDDLADGDVPGALVELAGRPGDGNCDAAGDEVGRAGEHEGDGLAEAEGLDNSGEEVLEAVGCQVHVSHEGEDPDHGVLGGLAETSPDRGVLALSYGIDGHAGYGEVALLLGEPPGVVREVGEEEEAEDGDDEGDDTLEDEEPLPS